MLGFLTPLRFLVSQAAHGLQAHYQLANLIVFGRVGESNRWCLALTGLNFFLRVGITLLLCERLCFLFTFG